MHIDAQTTNPPQVKRSAGAGREDTAVALVSKGLNDSVRSQEANGLKARQSPHCNSAASPCCPDTYACNKHQLDQSMAVAADLLERLSMEHACPAVCNWLVLLAQGNPPLALT